MGTSGTKDAFDQWWEWATKPDGSSLSIPAEIHNVVMTLTAEQRKDRELVNEAVRMAAIPYSRSATPIASVCRAFKMAEKLAQRGT